MSYELYIGDRSFSSWSLRGWLMFEKFNIPCCTHLVGLYSGTLKRDLEHLAPARLVPVMRTPEGDVVGDTLAIAETLAERHPEKDLWPKAQNDRAKARWIVAELHSGFSDLRTDCPMQLLGKIANFSPSDQAKNDLHRLEEVWTPLLNTHDGPWLFGTYTIADAFFTPFAARIAGYGLNVSKDLQTYVDTHLSDNAFRQWRALGLTKSYDPIPYLEGIKLNKWSGPETRFAQKSKGPSENIACPYSGQPVTHFLQIEGVVWGFCNASCRDKTLNDPDAWPAFNKMVKASFT